MVRIAGAPNPNSWLNENKPAGSCGSGGFISDADTIHYLTGNPINNQGDRNRWNAIAGDPQQAYAVAPIVQCPSGNGNTTVPLTPDRACIQFLPYTETPNGKKTDYGFPVRYLGPGATTPSCRTASAQMSSIRTTVGTIKSGGFSLVTLPTLLQ